MSSAFMLTGRSARSDPFYEEPPGKAFYHPSKHKKLSKTQKKTALQADSNEADTAVPSKADQKFLSGSHAYKNKQVSSEGGPKEDQFDESWPDTERPSTVSIPSLDNSPSVPFDAGTHRTKSLLHELYKKYDMPERDKGPSGGKTQNKDRGSTLSKYIERFRHGVPTSREERNKNQTSASQDFWWLGSQPPTPTDSSTPKDEGSRIQGRTGQSSKGDAPGRRGDSTGSLLTEANLRQRDRREQKIRRMGDPGDEATRRLQEKADRLLEKTASTLNSSDPIVSTDGLGSTLSHTSGSTYQEMPYRPAFTKPPEEGKNPYNAPGQPGEDILQQWRLRRKMEIARERVATGTQGEGVKHTPEQQASKQANAADDDIESKLAAFRQRLAQPLGSLPRTEQSQPLTVHTPAKVNFTQAPQQVDAAAQTSTERLQECYKEQNVQQTPHHTHSPIASPHLPHRTLQEPHKNNSVEPHHHLSCDIIPCPSQHASYNAKYGSDLAISQEFLKEPTNQDQIPERDTDNRTDSETEIKTLNDLKNTLTFDGLSSSEVDTENEMQVKPKNYTKSSVSRNLERELRDKKVATIKERNIDPSGARTTGTKMDSAHDRNDKLKSERGKVTRSEKEERGTRSSQKQETHHRQSEKAKPKSRPLSQSTPQESKVSPRMSVRGTVGKVVSEHLFASTSQSVISSTESLPQRKHVNSTVRDSRELSDITSVSLLSSVDSLSATQIEKPSVSDLHLEQPARHTASNAQVEQPTKLSDDTMVEQPSTSKSACRSMKKDKEQGKPVIPLQSVQDLELAVASDGEDFPEDEILKDLRTKREQYLIRLREIEGLMEQCNSEIQQKQL